MPSKDKGSKNTTQETIEESFKARVLKDLSHKAKIRECMGIEAANDAIEEMLSKGSKVIYESYIRPKVKPYTALQTIGIFRHVMNQHIITRDFGMLEQEEVETLWEGDEEPAA